MNCPKHRRLTVLLAAMFVLSAITMGAAYADLFSYVSKPDDAFKWELQSTRELPAGKVYNLHMVSQVWQGITWEHSIQVFEPQRVTVPGIMALLITGGDPSFEYQGLALMIANSVGARIAVLYNIPNQPLFGGLGEDALISYTWVKYLQTGDEDWVLLFPMVKSAIRAMDCLQQLAEQQWGVQSSKFVVLGASKRGWTTYLTGIADPARVTAIAPMVFDILNMAVNALHQREFWGDFSEMISDYTEKGMEQFIDTGRGFRLFWMADPYSYRDKLLMPKLVILGSNDAYWPIDAVNFYWAGLSQPKLLLIVPNSGHGLEDRGRLLGSFVGFFRLVAAGKSLPRVHWRYEETAEGLTLHVTADPQPIASRLWVARSAVRDFRKAEWEKAPLVTEGGEQVGRVSRAEGRYTAVYGELVFDVDGTEMFVSTQPRVMCPVAK